MEALRMRTGVETLGQNRLKTDYDTDTYDERVFQGGIGASNKLRADTAYTNSAAGLNVANTDRVNLATDIRRGSKNSEISRNISTFNRDSAQARAQKIAYQDPSYGAGLIAQQNQGLAEATLARNTADLQNTVIKNPIYQENFIAAELARMGQTKTIAQIDEQIANDPQTLKLAEQNLELSLTNAMTAVNNAETDLKLSNSADFQANRFNAGLSTAELGQVQGEEAVLLAKQSLAVNAFIREWGKTGNPDDPTSMRNLVKGISQLNPIMGQKLSQDYGEHELWEITNRGLRMRAEVNEALSTRGAAGAQEILDKYNGDKFDIKTVINDDGSMSMVETRAAGPGGQETEIVRTIASGADEKTFIQDLNAAMDPASLMEYSMNLVDMDYKRAVTKYNEAQAKAALSGKPLSATDQAYRTMVDTKASPTDRKLATAFLMRESPELYAELIGQMDVQGLIDGAGSGSGDNSVPEKLVPPVVLDAPVTDQEEATASQLMETLLSANATDRKALLSGRNAEILAKVAPDFLVMEKNKDRAANTLRTALDRGKIDLTPAGLAEFTSTYENIAAKEPTTGLSNNQKTIEMASEVVNAMEGQTPEVLNILIAQLQSEIRNDARGPAKVGQGRKNTALTEQIAALEKLVTELMQDR
jgi:hypothetical protein